MIDLAGLAAYRLEGVRRFLHDLTLSPDYTVLYDIDLVGATTLRRRHWNLCRSLATPANAMLLGNDSAYTAIWKEIHNQPVIMLGNLHDDWETTGTRYALSQQLVLAGLNEDGLWRPIQTYSQAVAELLPEADRPSYFVDSHFSTSISEALEWLGISVGPRGHGDFPPAPLTMRDSSVQLERGVADPFEVSAFGGATPYVFTIESQSTAGVFSVSGDTISVSVAGLMPSDGVTQTAILKVTDANGHTDTATITLATPTT